MVSQATIAQIKFGYGLGGKAPQTAADILARLGGPDRVREKYPVVPLARAVELARALARARKGEKAGKGGARAQLKAARREIDAAYGQGFVHALARIVETDNPFFERLTWFWADHFTATPKNASSRAAAPAYVDEAIRPHVTGRFADMLKAVVTHPFMLLYLDQVSSVGPNSAVGRKRGAGLNENLARELLELHTLGVGAPYTQDDVRQMAELLTGLTFSPRRGFVFRPEMAEPGAKRILGKRYGGGTPRLEQVFEALEDLALRPETARHLCTRLATHFVADSPDPGLVAEMEAAWRASGGDLPAVYEAMLGHPAAWAAPLAKVKQPFDYVASALLALGFSGEELAALERRDIRRYLFEPLKAMGQPFMGAPGPDGWPEEAEAWITPQGLAVRIAWADAVARQVASRVGDPRRFVRRALNDAAGEDLLFAARAAETEAEGVMLVLASAEFNSR